MGGGSWTTSSYSTYRTNTTGMNATTFASASLSTNQIYKSSSLDKYLDPKGVVRECCDTEEHPETIPVILALDVTGSMGSAARKVAQQLGTIMADIYESTKDVEFMIMGIGDLSYDDAPIQASQFESDIRIAEQLDKLYFEAGGGGNGWESYTAAWYFGLHQTKLDCWKRGKKGIIITLGDEPLNPYLPKRQLNHVLGSTVESDVDTTKLYKEVLEKFEVFHLSIDDNATSYSYNKNRVDKGWQELLGENYQIISCDALPAAIAEIVKKNGNISGYVMPEPLAVNTDKQFKYTDEGFITW